MAERRGRNRPSGRSSMSTRVTECRAARVAAVSVPIRPGADDDDAAAVLGQLRGQLQHAGAGGVLVRDVDAGDRRQRVGEARRPHDRLGHQLDGIAAAGGRDRQAVAREVGVDDEPVDVADALRGELLLVGQQRQPAHRQRALGERRPVVRQAGPDHRHVDAVLAQPRGGGEPRDAVADHDHRSLHARIIPWLHVTNVRALGVRSAA